MVICPRSAFLPIDDRAITAPESLVKCMQTVLLIENDLATLVARALVLRSFGYTVLEATSQEDALQTCQEHPEPIRLVITRAAVDNYNSRELVTQLQLQWPRIRALFVLDESVGELADKQRLPRECALIQKPFRVDTLAKIIRELLSGPQSNTAASPVS